VTLYGQTERMKNIRAQVMGLDHSWDSSAQQYIDVYKEITGQETKS